MLNYESENDVLEALTDEQLELVSGGDLLPDGDIPICPPWWPGHPPGIIPAHAH